MARERAYPFQSPDAPPDRDNPRASAWARGRARLKDITTGKNTVGLVTGLAWTSVGGETLEVEVNVMEGSGKLELTGNLGDVMKESAHAAYSYIRANAEKLGVAADFYKTKDIHVHFPEGAVPKDGPSAGVTVCTAIVSALTNTPVRSDEHLKKKNLRIFLFLLYIYFSSQDH